MTTPYKGNSKVNSPCNEIVQNILGLADQAQSMHDFMTKGAGYRKWNQGWNYERGYNPWSLSEAHDNTFSRINELDKQYNEIYSRQSSGTDGDARVVKLQAAYLQAMERSFNQRHVTLVRSEALAASRRFGHAHEKGPLKGPSGVLGYIQKLIEKSQA